MKPEVVRVEVPGAPYEVAIGPGLLGDIGRRVRLVSKAEKVAVLSDDNVNDLFGTIVERRLGEAGYEVHSLSVTPGEESKCWAVAGQVLETLAEFKLGRGDLIVALGGGVIGDLAGFAAATYLRGIGFVQVPTTLLAQVDSSVGGKTGVDLRAGKNLAGAFKQPMLVAADTTALSSLPQREWASGLAEVVKSAVIDSEEFLGWLEGNAEALRGKEPSVVAAAVRRSVEFKAAVVSADEKELGVRECLNYGHTLGHAIENVAGYGVVSHGEAVAEGMRFAAALAVKVCGASPEFVRRQGDLLDSLGLDSLDVALDPEEVLRAMRNDKKVRLGSIRWVLPTLPGQWSCRPVEESAVLELLEAWSKSKGKGSR